MRTYPLVIACILAPLGACGGDDDGAVGDPADAAGRIDAGTPDAAAPDAALLDGLWFVMDSIRIPETASEATSLALDLDSDTRRDNALGGLLAALHNQTELAIAGAQQDAVEAGDVLMLVGIDAASLDDDPSVPLQVSRADDLDGDAGDNFSGAEPFALVPLDGADGQLDGRLAGGRVRGGPGTIPIELAIVGVTPQVIALRGVGGRIVAAASDDGLTLGRLGAAFSEAEVDEVLIPALAIGFDSIVQRDCPGGVCEPGTQGEELATFFDDNEDGMVTVEELRANSLIASTVGNPDLDLFDADGAFNPNVDGVRDSLSLGLGFTAVGARAYQ